MVVVVSSRHGGCRQCLTRFILLLTFLTVCIACLIWKERLLNMTRSTVTTTTTKEEHPHHQRTSSSLSTKIHRVVGGIRGGSINWSMTDAKRQALLDVFRDSMLFSKRPLVAGYPDEWLPIILRSDGRLFCKKEHWDMLKPYHRMRLFSNMMHYAVTYDPQKVRELLHLSISDDDNDKNIHFHLPLSSQQKSIPLIFAIGDMRECNGTIFPRFSWCTLPESEPCDALAIPTYSLYEDQPQTTIPNVTGFHQTLEEHYPWTSKKRQAVWRGTATGWPMDTISSSWESLPRAILVNYSIYHSELLDAALTGSSDFYEHFPTEGSKLDQNSRFTEQMKMSDYQKFRAIVDIDGHSWSARFGSLLCMNSVVIKVEPRNKNYFFPDLVPWVHYIPVRSDMSDLLEAIQFAVSDEHEKQVRSIVYQANEFCRTCLTKQAMVMDLFFTLNSYIEHLGNQPEFWQQWDELETLLQEKKLKLIELHPKSWSSDYNNTSWLYQPLAE